MSEESNSLKVAIDTNIVISGTISPNSTPRQLIEIWSEGKFEWVMTEEVFEEMNLVLSREKGFVANFGMPALRGEFLPVSEALTRPGRRTVRPR
jgi:predicted nucleic acid-binding protein